MYSPKTKTLPPKKKSKKEFLLCIHQTVPFSFGFSSVYFLALLKVRCVHATWFEPVLITGVLHATSRLSKITRRTFACSFPSSLLPSLFLFTYSLDKEEPEEAFEALEDSLAARWKGFSISSLTTYRNTAHGSSLRGNILIRLCEWEIKFDCGICFEMMVLIFYSK